MKYRKKGYGWLFTLQRQLISFIPNMESLEIPIYNLLAAGCWLLVAGYWILDIG
ncbi:MAG: hypothetical protein L6422_06110 [Candidatus Marinimicrobia bacterium]|nr:hypothetical protein [Candidatus Neomarinimicrobiota bacterium]